MEVTFYTQSSRALGDIVKELAADSSSIRIAVAYLSADGLEEVRSYFQVHESLTPEQEKVLTSLNAVVQRETSFTFKNEVNPTLSKEGRQTIHKKHNNNFISSCNLMKPGQTTPFKIVLPNGSTVDGKIRYGHNNWGDYYEIIVGDKDNRSQLNKLISEDDMLEYYVDIVQRSVSISITST